MQSKQFAEAFDSQSVCVRHTVDALTSLACLLQALSACAVLYVIVGVCGYLAFRER